MRVSTAVLEAPATESAAAAAWTRALEREASFEVIKDALASRASQGEQLVQDVVAVEADGLDLKTARQLVDQPLLKLALHVLLNIGRVTVLFALQHPFPGVIFDHGRNVSGDEARSASRVHNASDAVIAVHARVALRVRLQIRAQAAVEALVAEEVALGAHQAVLHAPLFTADGAVSNLHLLGVEERAS